MGSLTADLLRESSVGLGAILDTYKEYKHVYLEVQKARGLIVESKSEIQSSATATISLGTTSLESTSSTSVSLKE